MEDCLKSLSNLSTDEIVAILPLLEKIKNDRLNKKASSNVGLGSSTSSNVKVDSYSSDSVTVYSDGGAVPNPGRKGIGYVIKCNGINILEVGKYGGQGTNNEAEYQALTGAMEDTLNLGFKKAIFHIDSAVVEGHLTKNWNVNATNLKPLYQKAKSVMKLFDSIRIIRVPRARNSEADALATRGIESAGEKI